MSKPFRVVAFDAYGTLLDVHSAVARHAASIGPEAGRLSDLWRQKQLEYSWVLSLADRIEPFGTLTARALDHALARCGSVDPALRAPLLDAYRRLDAYADAPDALRALAARGLPAAILSNGDPAMLAEAVAAAGLGPLLDRAISVEAAGIFKTAPGAYALVTAAYGCRPDEVAFVSSNRWDVAGAAAFGFSAIWVNRAGLPDEYPGLDPVAIVADLGAVRDVLR